MTAAPPMSMDTSPTKSRGPETTTRFSCAVVQVEDFHLARERITNRLRSVSPVWKRNSRSASRRRVPAAFERGHLGVVEFRESDGVKLGREIVPGLIHSELGKA